MKTIKPNRWSKDHWSLLAYVATRFDGEIDRRHLRCNPETHPVLGLASGRGSNPWKDEYSTRLKNPMGIQSGHDDWDCLEDLEAAGFIEVISTINGFVRMTKEGNDVAFRLRHHKEQGGVFADFSL